MTAPGRLYSTTTWAKGVLCALILFGCTPGPQPPSDLHARFAEWFVTPRKQLLDTLLHYRLNAEEWDSLIESARPGSVKAGAFRKRLEDIAGRSYTLGYQTPDTIDPDTTYPLIVYLHGGTGTRRTDKGAEAYGMMRALADTFSLFLASPSANREAPWWSAGGLQRILQCLRYMSLHYPINPDKVFLAGVSDGGTGCYVAAAMIPGPFAGFFAVSGFGGLALRMGIPLHPENLMQRPIYNVNAGKDRLYPAPAVKSFLDKLQRAGVTIHRSFHPDRRHGFAYRAEEMGTIASLIRRWSRPGSRRGISWKFTAGFPASCDNVVSWRLSGSGSASVSAYHRLDTLIVTTRGLKELVVSRAGNRGNRPLRVRANETPVRTVSPLPTISRERFLMMQQRGIPEMFREQPLYRITLK